MKIKIENLEKNVNDNSQSIDEKNYFETNKEKRNQKIIRKRKLKRTMIGSNSRYEDLCKTKMEKRNYTNKTVQKIKDEKENNINNMNEILNYMKHYYENYTQKIKRQETYQLKII